MSPCREPPRRRASLTGLPADPAGAPCRAGVCRRPGALRHCPPVVGSAAINASLAVGTPGDASRPSAYIPGDARERWQSLRPSSGFRGISARKRAAVFHGPLDSLPSANTNSLESHDQIPVCWYWGAGGEALQSLLFGQAVGAVRPEPGAEEKSNALRAHWGPAPSPRCIATTFRGLGWGPGAPI